MENDISRRVVAEFFGTLWLVLGGCGAAVLAAGFPNLGIGFLGVAFAFGLTVLTMAYAVGHISGGHFNPAVTVGLWSAGRCPSRYVIPYIIAQVIGAIVAAFILWLIASGKTGWVMGGFAANGYGDLSPGKYSLGSCFISEIVMTFFFLFVIIGTTSRGAAAGFAGIPIGTICRRRIYRPALAVLGGADYRRGHSGIAGSLDVRARSHRRNRRGRRKAGDPLMNVRRC